MSMSCSLKAQIPTRCQFSFESDILNPSQPTLAEALTSNSAVLVVTDHQTNLHQYFFQQQQRGWIREFRILHFSPKNVLQDPWQTLLTIIQAGVDLQLRRSDAYVAYASTELTTLTALAAGIYRRSIRFVQIQDGLEGVLNSLGTQGFSQVRWVGYHSKLRAIATIGLNHLNTVTLVDEAALSRSLHPASAVKNIELLKLAIFSDRNLFRELQLYIDTNSTADNSHLSQIIIHSLKTVSQEILLAKTSPLEFGEPFAELSSHLSASPITPAEAQACGIMLAALFSQAIGLLPAAVVHQIWALLNHAGFENCLTRLTIPAWTENQLTNKLLAWSNRYKNTSFLLIEQIGRSQTVKSQDVLSDINIQRVISALKACQTNIIPQPEKEAQERAKATVKILNKNLIQYSVPLVNGILEPANSSLSACFRKGQRILAVVDAYDGNQAPALKTYLDHQFEIGKIASYKLHLTHFTSAKKDLDAVLEIIDQANQLQLKSQDLIVVMGGGTLMDIAGFAAALYQGGINYIRIPTTFVGLIDAGVGLKVGVNYGNKKNFLGTYYPSAQCLCDKFFLQTLPIEEIRCGLAEAIKIALVKDASLFALIEEHYSLVLARSEEPVIDKIMMQSIALMLEELESNPYEKSPRRLPDFGHEFGHVLESLTHHELRHGEAVAIGMALSCHIAWNAGLLKRSILERVLKLLLEVGLPIYHSACQPEILWQKLFEDVITHKMGRLHLVVPTDIGKGTFLDDIGDINLTMLQQACIELKKLSIQPQNYSVLEADCIPQSETLKTRMKAKQPLLVQSLGYQEEQQ